MTLLIINTFVINSKPIMLIAFSFNYTKFSNNNIQRKSYNVKDKKCGSQSQKFIQWSNHWIPDTQEFSNFHL